MHDSGSVSEFLSMVDIDGYEDLYRGDISGDNYFGMPLKAIVECERRLRSKSERCFAYFSMEYGLATSFYNKFNAKRPVSPNNKIQDHEVFSNFRLADYFFTLKADNIMDLPIYSGGLGVLAGDTAKTMADYRLPAVCIGILWSTGYFRQRFWFKYGQMPEKIHWDPESYPGLVPLKNKIKVRIKDSDIHLRLWKYYVYNYKQDYAIPLILLDADISENDEAARQITGQLYKSESSHIKILQRIVLGMGGVLSLQELGYNIDTYHLNEGHGVFAFAEKARGLSKDKKEALKKHFVYTCHTPVKAGHDSFPRYELEKLIKKEDLLVAEEFGSDGLGMINFTLFAMNIASCINAVSKSHQAVMHAQFPEYKEAVKYVTNGVHPHTWISSPVMSALSGFSAQLGDVKDNPLSLAGLRGLKSNQDLRRSLWQAHQSNKAALCDFLKGWGLKEDIFTLCWARRVAAYKRPSLIFQDVSRLIDISKKAGPIQIIFAGKAHPADDLGFTHINEILDEVDNLTGVYESLKIVMLENYEIFLARMLTCGVDVWLNNPLPPFEASGTSGMKAILNGVIQLSTLDGWVVEAQDKNIGRIFGYKSRDGFLGDEHDLHIEDDSVKLYEALEELVNLYYLTNKSGKINLSSGWIDMMIDCVATGADFNTYRMLNDYKQKVWNIA